MDLEDFRRIPRHWQSYFANETTIKFANNGAFLEEFNFALPLPDLDYLGNLAYLSLYAPDKYSEKAENYLITLNYPFIDPPNDPNELLNKMPKMSPDFVRFVGISTERKSNPLLIILSVFSIFILIICFRYLTE